MVDWLELRAEPIRAVEHGVDAAGGFEMTYTGPRTFEALNYPAAEVLPRDSARSAGNEWTHRIMANLYFRRERDDDYVDDVLHRVAEVITETLDALAQQESVIAYYPASIEDYAGELDGSLVLLVSIEFEVTTRANMATT